MRIDVGGMVLRGSRGGHSTMPCGLVIAYDCNADRILAFNAKKIIQMDFCRMSIRQRK